MSTGKCQRHPRQVVVGICAACLRDRLLVLMVEEEELEVARSSFASSSSMEASSPIYKVPGAYTHTSSDSSFNIFTDHCKASVASSIPRRHGMEYNREDVKHVASLYLQRHHSLSSSPLQNPKSMKVSSPLPSSMHHDIHKGRKSNALLYRDLTPCNPDDHVAAGSTPRKKKGSIWSLLQRHGIESGSSSMRKDCSKVEQHRRSLQGNSTFYKSAYMNGSYNGNHEQHIKLPYASSLNFNALDTSSKVNASSLNSSPRSFRSTHASGHTSSHMLSPANSRLVHCTPHISPLPTKREVNRNVEPGRRHSFADDSTYDIADYVKPSKSYHESALDGNKSWISSLFFSRGKSSKSLLSKGNDATHVYATHNPSRQQSMAASPEIAPRRKSVSFLDEHVAARSPRTTRFKTSPEKKLSHDSMKMGGSNIQHDKASALQGMHNKHGFTGENVMNNGLHGNGSLGAYHLNIKVGNNEQQLKSPRMRMANFLSKRRNSMGMDCTRDMRVSPAPMSITEIRNPSHSHRNLPLMKEEDVDEEVENYGSLYTGTSRSENGGNRSSSNVIKLVPASMLDAELEDVMNRSKESKAMDSYSRSSKSKRWSSAWSKTLSPMLGLRGKKKKKKGSSSSNNGAVQDHSNDNNGALQDNNILKKTSNAHHDLTSNSDRNLSIDCSHINHCRQTDHSCSRSPSVGVNAELQQQISTPRLSPSSMFTPTHKRPPQHYSFLSKDYSAFSFYFSPRSSSSNMQSPLACSGNVSNQMISDQIRRLNAADQLINAGPGTPPRHSVDGTFPSLFKKASPSAAALLAGVPNGRS